MAGPQPAQQAIYTGNSPWRGMRGFSLLEVLIAVVIFSFILMGMYGVVTVANRNYSTDAALVDLGQQARQSMFWMTKDMREASSISIATIDSNYDSIVFNSTTESGIRYYCNSAQLIREYPINTTRVVANNISRLKFSRTGNILEIRLEAEKTLPSNDTFSFPLTEKVRLRNE
jgi:prepilin-type N-terminal cleavage/methylation domain-containing protein